MYEQLLPEFIKDLVANNLPYLLSFIKSTPKTGSKPLKKEISKSLSEYIISVSTRYGHVKTILNKNIPAFLYDFYVPLDVIIEGNTIRNASFEGLTTASKFILITGNAGAGKSVFLKYLMLEAIREKKYIPVFVELRNITEKVNLLDFIYENMKLHNFSLPRDSFNHLLSQGRFTFFYDGYDETKRELRPNISKDIIDISVQYCHNKYVVSSRPDNEFLSWSPFITGTIAPMDIHKCTELIKKLNYNQEIKESFIKRLEEKYFNSFTSFVTNPLLLTIMLLTYDEYAEVPDKMSLFYSSVYDTLFCKHDATKHNYCRQFYSSLDKNDFHKVLSSFSAVTLFHQIYSFDEKSCISDLDKLKEITGINYDSIDVLNDMIKSLCLLIEENAQYKFIHRSFQEYFAAVFTITASKEKREKLLKRAACVLSMNFLHIAHEINKNVVEVDFIIPFLISLKTKIGFSEKIDRDIVDKFYALLVRALFIQPNGTGLLLPPTESDSIYFLEVLSFLNEHYYKFLYHNMRLDRTATYEERKNIMEYCKDKFNSLSFKERNAETVHLDIHAAINDEIIMDFLAKEYDYLFSPDCIVKYMHLLDQLIIENELIDNKIDDIFFQKDKE